MENEENLNLLQSSNKRDTEKIKAWKFVGLLSDWAHRRPFVVFIVFLVLFVDNTLLTAVVPIVPHVVYNFMDPRQSNSCKDLNGTTSSVPSKECAKPDGTTVQLVVGLLLGVDSFAHLLFIPVVGSVTNRYGSSLTMFIGSTLLFTACVVFTFNFEIAAIGLAKIIHGIGTAFNNVGCLSCVATMYKEDGPRAVAISAAFSGIAVGLLLGPTFGAVFYSFVGPASPFIFLASVCFTSGMFQILVYIGNEYKSETEGVPLLTLLQDPYIVLAASVILVLNVGNAGLDGGLPLFAMEKLNAPIWLQGLLFLAPAGCYLLTSNVFGVVGLYIGRWICVLLGLIVFGAAIFAVTFSKSIFQIAVTTGLVGVGIGMSETCVFIMLGQLVDTRYKPMYGTVYAIGDLALCVAYGAGPILVGLIGFSWLTYMVGIAAGIIAPFFAVYKHLTLSKSGNSKLNYTTAVVMWNADFAANFYLSQTQPDQIEDPDIDKNYRNQRDDGNNFSDIDSNGSSSSIQHVQFQNKEEASFPLTHHDSGTENNNTNIEMIMPRLYSINATDYDLEHLFNQRRKKS